MDAPGTNPHATMAEHSFSARDAEFVYRPISVMAIVCLLASLVSLVTFFNYYLIPIALVVLVISVLTSIRLERAKNEYEGQLLSKIAILVGLVATIGAGTVHAVTYVALSREARAFSEEYLRLLLADKLEEAFRMRIAPAARAYCKDDLKEIMFQYNKEFEAFKQEKITEVLRAGGSNATIEFLGASQVLQYAGLDLIGTEFRVTLPGPPRRVFRLMLGIHGGVSQAGDWIGRQWYVSGNDKVGEELPPAPAQPQEADAIKDSAPEGDASKETAKEAPAVPAAVAPDAPAVPEASPTATEEKAP